MSGGGSGGGCGNQHQSGGGAVAMGEVNRTEEAMAGVVTTVAMVAVNPEVMEMAMEAEAVWEEVTVLASINLVSLGTKDHVMTLNRIIQTTVPS